MVDYRGSFCTDGSVFTFATAIAIIFLFLKVMLIEVCILQKLKIDAKAKTVANPRSEDVVPRVCLNFAHDATVLARTDVNPNDERVRKTNPVSHSGANRLNHTRPRNNMKIPNPYGWTYVCLLVLGLFSASAWAGDAAAGKALFPVCTACHGPTGQGNQAMNAPKLAGLSSWYFIKQMQLFQNDARGTAPGDMHGMQMAAMAKGPQLTGDAALANLAAYVATFPDEPTAQTVAGDAKAGAALYPVCAACHGQRAEGIEAMAGPRLAGQNDWYLVAQIKKFQKGQRGYHNSDHGGRQMRPMASTLTSEQAINDVVAYIRSMEAAD